ncbi:hypothetical protein Acr_23g0000160 [Actinidia rufa]|uniref:Uncharacterized protein n=1 Tax=Actinidia rufa TaxID=165716 RepID=A0A7J0GLK4_9ERIC|nr:hypothetical protein Acr_23g0000160 [Actinidia rufa]
MIPLELCPSMHLFHTTDVGSLRDLSKAAPQSGHNPSQSQDQNGNYEVDQMVIRTAGNGSESS